MQLNKIFSKLIPKTVDDSFYGLKLPVVVFMVIAVISTVRSLIHIFSPDGGAGSIAGLDLSVEGASGIVFVFALWGSAQFVVALVQLIIAFRYRSLIPLMYVLLILEVFLRILISVMKPVDFSHTPPGAIGNWVVLPIAILMLVLCFVDRKHED